MAPNGARGGAESPPALADHWTCPVLSLYKCSPTDEALMTSQPAERIEGQSLIRPSTIDHPLYEDVVNAFLQENGEQPVDWRLP